MTVSVIDIIKAMEYIAPISIAEDFDNPGLQIGQTNWPVQSVAISLDPLIETVEKAISLKADMLITHHPLIFSPLKKIDFSSYPGTVLYAAAKNRLAIFSAHTNLDKARGGINDLLALKIGLKNIGPFIKEEERLFKIVFFVPLEAEKQVIDTILKSGAGKIGRYLCCSFRTRGKGTFKPEAEASPYIGEVGKLTEIEEVRIETVVRKELLDSVLQSVRKVHPYETMASDIYPLAKTESFNSLGRTGEIEKPLSLIDFAKQIKEKLNLPYLKIAGKENLTIKKAALCSGSGSSLLNDFIASNAQVYISGDLRYHDAVKIKQAGLGIIDIGHFCSEHIIIKPIADRLKETLDMMGIGGVKIHTVSIEEDPFKLIQ